MNQIAEIVLDAFKELAWDVVVREALKKLLAVSLFGVPVLGWWPFSEIITRLVFYFSDELYQAFSKLIDTRLIIFRNKKFHNQFVSGSLRLREIALGHGVGSAEFRKARDEERESLSQFVLFDIAR